MIKEKVKVKNLERVSYIILYAAFSLGNITSATNSLPELSFNNINISIKYIEINNKSMTPSVATNLNTGNTTVYHIVNNYY